MASMVWEATLPDSSAGPGPTGRTWHSMVCMQGKDREPASLLLYGGFSNDNRVLRDCWKLNLDSENLSWQRSGLGFCQPRWWHSMVVIDSIIIVMGGLLSETVHPTESLVVDIKPRPLVNICHK